MTNPSFVNRVETLPPIGASDHDIVYSEINLALPPIHKHIPTKSISNKSRLPWVNNQLKKLINKKNKL
jgi:hypothetical protein